MSYTPSNHSKPWTPEEVSTFERLLAEGASLRDIARELGRTRGSLSAKASALRASRMVDPDPAALMSLTMAGKPLSHRRTWTPEDVSELKRLISEGRPLRAIARELGRTEEAVRTKAQAENVSRKAPYRPS